MKRAAALLALALSMGARPVGFQHTVRIAWAASVDAIANPSLTYNVYRASSCPGYFVQLNTAPVVGTFYVDTAVAAGASYCYQVTSVLSGVEGSPSIQAVASIPGRANREESCEHRGAIIDWIRCVASRPKPGSIGP